MHLSHLSSTFEQSLLQLIRVHLLTLAVQTRALLSLVLVFLTFAIRTRSAYDEWLFTTATMLSRCPDQAFGCRPPSVCGQDDLLDKYYCCDAGSSDTVCWAQGYNCSSSAASMQQACGADICCLNDREVCSSRIGIHHTTLARSMYHRTEVHTADATLFSF
jgi:hypothetical protein